jgi:hypothetical protein
MKMGSKIMIGPPLLKNIANMSISVFLNAHINYFLDLPEKKFLPPTLSLKPFFSSKFRDKIQRKKKFKDKKIKIF